MTFILARHVPWESLGTGPRSPVTACAAHEPEEASGQKDVGGNQLSGNIFSPNHPRLFLGGNGNVFFP